SRLAACIGTMPIEKDSQSYLARVIDQLIHDLKSAETRQIRIPVEVDAAGSIAGIESLCAERQAQRVVSEALDLIEHVSPIAGPKSVRAKGVCLHPEPVNPRHPHRLAVGVHDLAAVGVPESRAAADRDLRLRRRCPGASNEGQNQICAQYY